MAGQDWTFWITAAAMALAVLFYLVAMVTRSQQDAPADAGFDLQVYRDQLAEVERDLARGTLSTEDAARLRTDLSRKVIDADRAAQNTTAATKPQNAKVVISITALALAGAAALYWQLGAPGYSDLPYQSRLAMAEAAYANRLDQTRAEARVPAAPAAALDPQYADLMEKLREAVKSRPDDLQGHILLAQNEAKLGNFSAAATAQSDVIRLKGTDAQAEDHASLAELKIMAAAGYVTPQAEADLKAALHLDPRNGTSLFYTGLMFEQLGRPDRAFLLWRGLLENSVPGDPWYEPIASQIEELAVRAGERYTAPTGLKGPDAGAMSAAAAMSEGDRAQMIQGMVSQLSERLATEGGTPEEWAQLISAYGVLKKTAEAKAAWAAAQKAYSGADLEPVMQAAQTAGAIE